MCVCMCVNIMCLHTHIYVYACVPVCESSMCIRVTIAQVIHCTEFIEGNENGPVFCYTVHLLKQELG